MAEAARKYDLFVPAWLEQMWYRIRGQRYTGPITLHCREGEVVKVEEKITREPKDYLRK